MASIFNMNKRKRFLESFSFMNRNADGTSLEIKRTSSLAKVIYFSFL